MVHTGEGFREESRMIDKRFLLCMTLSLTLQTMNLQAAEKKGTIQGADFAAALFSIWLGGKPIDKTLKKQLLGAP